MRQILAYLEACEELREAASAYVLSRTDDFTTNNRFLDALDKVTNLRGKG